MVTTDVLAEGVNLQQARHIFNYDLPWNPMRLVQRHGRIDRIGSHHSEVFVHCVFPDSRLDEMLRLEKRLNDKIKQADVTVGVPEILPGQTAAPTCMDYTDDKQEIKKLRRQAISSRKAAPPEAFSRERPATTLVHARYAVDPARPCHGISPLGWARATGSVVANLEQRLGEDAGGTVGHLTAYPPRRRH